MKDDPVTLFEACAEGEPRIRFELRGLTYVLERSLLRRFKETPDWVDAQIRIAVDAIDVDKVIREQVERTLPAAIQCAIENAVRVAVNTIDLRSVIEGSIRAHVEAQLGQRTENIPRRRKAKR